MKFALNHPWKFERPHFAFFVGLHQTFTVFVIELFTYVSLIGSTTNMEIVLTLLIFLFILNFSSYIFH